jgi:hypothetical protein
LDGTGRYRQVEWLFSVPWLRVGWYRKRQALPWWFIRLQAGGIVALSTLVKGWMVQK